MTYSEIRLALEAVKRAMGDLTAAELEELACEASEIRSQAWAIRAVKVVEPNGRF